jgi:site-specific DNA-methyltransferase (adenine-specific)
MGVEKVQIGECTLYRGDCLEVLPTLAGVDAVVTDPPYSSGGMVRGDRNIATSSKYQHGDTEKKHLDFTGDTRDQRSWCAWCAIWMAQCRQVVQPGGMIASFTDWRMLPTLTDAIQAGGWVWRGLAVWDKGNAIPQPNSFRAQCEYIVWGTNGPRVVDYAGGTYAPGLFTHKSPRERSHVTEKSVGLMADVVQLCPEGRTVLDPFMGSGTTGVACVQTGRGFIGVELSRQYFDIACRRIEAAYADSPLLQGGAA